MSQITDYEAVSNPSAAQRLAGAATSLPGNVEPLPRDAGLAAEIVNDGATPAAAKQILATDRWSLNRGHRLTFIALFLFSVVLYFRPYELIPSLSSYTSMAFFFGILTLGIYLPTQLLIEGNLTARPREINLILLLTLAAFLSMPLAMDPGEAYEEFTDVLLKAILIFIVMVNVIRTEWRFKMLIWLVFAVSVYLSVSAVSDYANGVFREGSAYYNDQRIGGAIGGLFGNSNDMALHLVTMVPLVIAFAFAGKSPVRKLIYMGLGVLFVAGIIVTFSRGGFLGLVVAIAVVVWKLGRRNKTLSTAILILTFLGILTLAPGSYAGRISSIFDSAADLTGSASQRTTILKRSFWVTLRYPLFGVGMGNFHHKSVQELVTHNAYTQVSSEMGIPALIVYIMFMVYPLKQLRKIEAESYQKPDKRKFYAWSIGIQTAIIAYMVASFFASVAYQWYIYYLVGYAIAARRLYVLHDSATSSPEFERISVNAKEPIVPSVSVPQPY